MMQHYLLSRFNVNVYQGVSADGQSFKTFFGRDMNIAPDAWIEHRLDLFRRFFIPSLLRQTNMDFTYLLFIDCETPSAYQVELRNILSLIGHIHSEIITVDNSVGGGFATHALACKCIKSRLTPTTKWVITSRVDNDDMLDRQFIELVQQQARAENRRVVINPNSGYVLELPDKVSIRKYAGGSPFVSFMEPAHERLETILKVQHTDINKLGPVVTASYAYQWVHIKHEWNAAVKKSSPMTIPFPVEVFADRFGYRKDTA